MLQMLKRNLYLGGAVLLTIYAFTCLGFVQWTSGSRRFSVTVGYGELAFSFRKKGVVFYPPKAGLSMLWKPKLPSFRFSSLEYPGETNIIVPLFLILPGIVFSGIIFFSVSHSDRLHSRCVSCGYDLVNLQSKMCPECGHCR
jgi:hypothetical protein